eukprot:scaffold104321_cov63-Phaeocystis_antarctica.AAC.2
MAEARHTSELNAVAETSEETLASAGSWRRRHLNGIHLSGGDGGGDAGICNDARSELSAGNRTTPALTSADDLDQHMAPSEVLILNETFSAWNVDGSSDALAQSGSWIRDAEEATGRKRGRCSFEGCRNQAEVGGHVWMARIGCVIAPICKPCNMPNNQHRMQGSGARLRKNIEVTRTEVTEGMHKAARRAPGVTHGGGWRQRRDRRCESCDDDIASRPGSHTQYYSCWRAVEVARSEAVSHDGWGRRGRGDK